MRVYFRTPEQTRREAGCPCDESGNDSQHGLFVDYAVDCVPGAATGEPISRYQVHTMQMVSEKPQPARRYPVLYR